MDHTADGIGACAGIDASVDLKRYFLDAALVNGQKYFNGVTAVAGVFPIAVRPGKAFQVVRAKSHFQKGFRVVTEKIKFLFHESYSCIAVD
jgi:hypothetical protein